MEAAAQAFSGTDVAVQATARTHVGHVRANNEDAYGCDVRAGVFCVADGLGGHPGGEVASRIARDTVLEAGRPEVTGDAELAALLFRGAAERAHYELLAHADAHPHEWGLGTTLTALRLRGSSAEVLHVGDSRAYRYRAGVLEPLTEDHSEVFDMLRSGELQTREQARIHPLSNIVTRCVGGLDPAAPTPDLLTLAVMPGDRFLLSTDGLTDMLPEAGIAALCGEHDDPDALADALLEAALAAGGRDNITLVVVDISRS